MFRAIYHGKKGEVYKHYKEDQEDQLNSLSLVTNDIVVWNTVYMQEAIKLLRARGEIINEEDVAKLSPLLSKHINILGKYSFVLPESVRDGKLRELDKENFP